MIALLIISFIISWVVSTQIIVPSMTSVIDVQGITTMLSSIITVDGILFGLIILPISVYQPKIIDSRLKVIFSSTLISSLLLVVSILSSLVSLGGVHSIEFANRFITNEKGTPIQMPYVETAPYMSMPTLTLVFSFIYILLVFAFFIVLFPSVINESNQGGNGNKIASATMP